MRRSYYSTSINDFLSTSDDAVLGQLARASTFSDDPTQKSAWLEEISILKTALLNRTGRIYFEYAIPRMGKRIDVLLIIGPAIFVLEFKVGESHFTSSALDQVTDYCLDLKNFHETSASCFITPILIPTAARVQLKRDQEPSQSENHEGGKRSAPPPEIHNAQLLSHSSTPILDSPWGQVRDKVLPAIRSTVPELTDIIDHVLEFTGSDPDIDADAWERGRYCPTPTIIEAALALYKGHSVDEISRNDASAINLDATSKAISGVIRSSKERNEKSICFVTGVPGSGKTLIGLNIATLHRDEKDQHHSVFLSGNEPLVAVLREALARDHINNQRKQDKKVRRGEARSKVRKFIQNVHHFRDECLIDTGPPNEHVTLFDEAQRAWSLKQTSDFMRQKKGVPDFDQSEPAFLISCLDRHDDWAVVVCLVGGGQEINTGEAGIIEWFKALENSFSGWKVFISSRLTDSEYRIGAIHSEDRSLTEAASIMNKLKERIVIKDELHLSVSMRSFRSENVSHLVKQLLDLDATQARQTLSKLNGKYPIVITRDLTKAKQWLRARARGTERYGILVSSSAERLKPFAIDVKKKINPIHWFLHGKDDIRSSYYLEDVATQFHVQGLEIDWACVTWDADLRHTVEGWKHWKFQGTRWNRVHKPERQIYLENAYRVLLTRARQGMVIVVPSGNLDDPTRKPNFYDSTFEYLTKIGFASI